MKKLALALTAILWAGTAAAQYQVPNYSIPIGRGQGGTGFKNAAPGAAGEVLTSNGPAANPSFRPAAGGGTPIEVCGAAGDGVTDDAPAFRTCMTQLNALTNGGTILLSCNKTYLLASFASGGTGPIVNNKSKVSIKGCGDSSVIKVANGMNSAGTSYFVFYPASNGIGDRVDNVVYRDFKIDNNGVNNRGTGGGTLYYNNINIGVVRGSNIVIDSVTFANNPGSQNIAINGTQGANTVTGVSIRNTNHLDSCDMLNAACTDHSSIFVIADNYEIIGNNCIYSSVSTRSTCWEQWGTGGVADSNTVKNYNKGFNTASLVFGISTRDQITSNNIIITREGYTLWCDGASSSFLRDITIESNAFRQLTQAQAYFDNASGIVADCARNLRFSNNTFVSDVAGGTAGTTAAFLLGRAANQYIGGNSFRNGLGPAIGNSTFTAATSFTIENNIIVDAGQTSTAASRRGILINSATLFFQARISNNTILNVASTYMTTCFDVTANVSTSSTSWVSTAQPANCASQSALTLTGGFATVSPAGIPYYQNAVGPLGSTAAVAGAALHTDPSTFVPALSVTPTVGVAGTTVGQWCMRNATSGTQCLSPATGALGSSVVTHPAGTYNVVGDTLTQTLTGKTLTSPVINTAQVSGVWSVSGTWTLPAITLGGTVSGGGNQLNNIIIGTTTPLAGTFTTVQTRGAANQGVDVLNNLGTTQINFRWNSSVGGYFGLSNVAGSITTQLFGEGVSDQYFAPTGAGASFGFNTTTPNNAQSGTVGVVTSNGGFKNSVVAVASLPTCNAANAGLRLTVNNATVTTFASVVAGGGANVVPVMCTGASWIIG